MSQDKLAQFADQKYINLQTFRKNGTSVATPVWFAEGGGELYVYTLANSGKMKRLRNNRRVRIAVSDLRGNLKGEWVDGEARLLDAAEAAKGNRLLTKKYSLLKRIMDFFSKFRKQQRAVFAIRVL
jgi:PPOX class probable F420-dependent enzyme